MNKTECIGYGGRLSDDIKTDSVGVIMGRGLKHYAFWKNRNGIKTPVEDGVTRISSLEGTTMKVPLDMDFEKIGSYSQIFQKIASYAKWDEVFCSWSERFANLFCIEGRGSVDSILFDGIWQDYRNSEEDIFRWESLFRCFVESFLSSSPSPNIWSKYSWVNLTSRLFSDSVSELKLKLTLLGV